MKQNHLTIQRKSVFMGISLVLAAGLTACSSDDDNTVETQSTWTHQQLIELSTSEAAVQIKEGKLTSVELTQALIQQSKNNSSLNAFITLAEDQVLTQAQAADDATKAGISNGALHGVPLVFKDNIHVAGLKNTAGTPALGDFTPSENAAVVQALVDEGAIILGKTNMHELAFGITSDNAAYGAVGNPYRPANTAGGSSGGSGSAIAARMAPAGLGTDTGGSVRVPAALNGITSLRPTVGRYAQTGITPISHTRDTAGPMARSVSDLILLDGIISGDATTVVEQPLNSLRIGIPRAYFYENLDPEVSTAIETALITISGAGATLLEVDLAGVSALNANIGFPVVLYEAVEDLTHYLSTFNTGVTFEQLAAQTSSPDVSGLFATLTTVDENNDGTPDGRIPESVYLDAINTHRPALQALFASYYSDNNLDAMIFPTTPLPARPTEGLLAGVELNGNIENTFGTYIRNTDPDSNAGLPGVTLPIGLSSDGLPVGLQVGGPINSDRSLLGIALSLENLLGRLDPPASVN